MRCTAANLIEQLCRGLAATQPVVFTTVAAHVPSINPMTPWWFTSSQLPTLINIKKYSHPSNAGYRFMATKFEAAYRALTVPAS